MYAVKKAAIHASNADYCVAAALYNGKVYTLCNVSNYDIPSHYQMFAIVMGINDISDVGERIYCSNPTKVKKGVVDQISIIFEGLKLFVKIDDENYLFLDDIESVFCHYPAPGFEYLYQIIDYINPDALEKATVNGMTLPVCKGCDKLIDMLM